MRKIVAGAVAVSLAAILAMPMAAEARTKKKQRTYVQPYSSESYRPPRSDYRYEEFIADKRRTGTSSWWEQMDREGRGGQGRPN